jgi:hypothetical protein
MAVLQQALVAAASYWQLTASIRNFVLSAVQAGLLLHYIAKGAATVLAVMSRSTFSVGWMPASRAIQCKRVLACQLALPIASALNHTSV